MQAVIDAVNIGYDTDTVATITGALVGAFVNLDDERFKELFVKVQDVNGFDLVGLASSLARVAHRRQ
ncbi:ADP-ribosylglycohydrolase domain protein [Olsenella profusa F0195]|uniref:ADP-ribosylglycohydrolase domain protein n=1 Tax=Olsenella profusa F0195 TaxID=1125712 RepID=U2TPT7_9ACTN|nr:ADP-ribosylglycohydrolase domain protein [Olsenella profusa F0195]